MRLEEYFEFLGPDDIRIRGHRIGIEDVLQYFLDGYTPEEIAAHLPTLNLEEIYATITYYLSHRAEVEAYLTRVTKRREQLYQEWAREPSPLVQRLRRLKARREQERVKAA